MGKSDLKRFVRLACGEAEQWARGAHLNDWAAMGNPPALKLVPFGKYCLSKPLVFSFEPKPIPCASVTRPEMRSSTYVRNAGLVVSLPDRRRSAALSAYHWAAPALSH